MTDAIPELVVLLDAAGAAIGTARKDTVHTADTPLHLAFSLYAFDASDRLLLTQRAASKVAFPLLWTNSVCGHPAPGEPLESAVRRRARDEMGLELAELRLVLPQFRYRGVPPRSASSWPWGLLRRTGRRRIRGCYPQRSRPPPPRPKFC